MGKRGRKPKVEPPTAETRKRSKSANKAETKDGGGSSSSEEEKQEESPKPAFLRETLSGRNPKPPQRYEEKEKKRKRHKSSGNNKTSKESDSSESESASPSRTNTPGPFSNIRCPKKQEELKI